MTVLREGETFAGFRVGGCIHAGSGVRLYRVKYAEGLADPGFPMVLKLPAGSERASDAGALRCEVEQQLLPALGGPHVPRFVAAGRVQDQPYLVREYVPGQTLAQWLQQPQRPTVEEVVRLAVALGHAVHSLHAQQVLHLDLQPGHVLVREDGRIVLLGLGRARRAGWPDFWSGQTPDAAQAAPTWAPEQLAGRRDEPRSDIHAIGVMLYQLLTGALPLDRRDGRLAGWRRRWLGPLPLRHHRPLLPDWLQDVVLRCLAYEPQRRYAALGPFVFDLQHRPVGAGRLPPGRMAGWRSRLAGAAAAAAGQATVVLVVLPVQDMPEDWQQSLRAAATRLLGAGGQTRLLCVTVLEPALPGQDEAAALRLQQLRLRHWARPMAQQSQALACEVLVGGDAATAVLACARRHLAGHVVLGLPAAQDVAAWQPLLAQGDVAVTVVGPPGRGLAAG